MLEIAEVNHVMKKISGMRKLLERWMSRLITSDNKWTAETPTQRCSSLFKRNPKRCLHGFVTVDVSWIHCTIQKLRNCRNSGLHPPNLFQKVEDCLIGQKRNRHRFFWLLGRFHRELHIHLDWIRQRTSASNTILFKFRSKRLILVFKLEKVSHGLKMWGYLLHRGPVCRFLENLFSR